jgi:hypothetical protein
MATITLDINAFRQMFPAFNSIVNYPDETLLMYFDMASNYVSIEDYGYLRGQSRTLALYLMLAHLLMIMDAIVAGNPLQAMTSASEGSVSIGLVPPPVKNNWQWWLASTAYGQQLLGLLSNIAVGGLYIGGDTVRAGFRKTNGAF